MVGPILTLDLGNSRLKLCVFPPGGAVDREPSQRVEVEPDSASLAAVLRDMPPLSACGFSSVAGPEVTARIKELVAPRTPILVDSTEHVLRNLSTDPAGVGKDRLFAALGAIRLAGDARRCFVIDAGTALTVDVAEPAPEGDAYDGAFVGGAIAAGAELCARALGRGGARLFEIEPRAGVRALGRDSREALESGVVHGLRGTTRELVTRMEEELGLASDERVPIFLTGGARGLLRGVFEDARVREVPQLVHAGILRAIEAHGGN